MAATISCPHCQSPLTVTSAMAGQTIRCPACQQLLQLAAATHERTPASVAPGFPWLAVLGTLAGMVAFISLGVIGVVAWVVFAASPNREEVTALRPEKPLPPAAPPFGTSPPGPPVIAPVDPLPAAAPPPESDYPALALPETEPPRTLADLIEEAPAGSPPGPSEPTPAAPTSVLSSVASAWPLPALLSEQQEQLGSLAGPASAPLELTLNSLVADIPPTAAIFAEPGPEPGCWSALYVSDSQAAQDRQLLGTFRLTGQQISFSWNSAAGAQLRRQLGNCLLELRHGDEQRLVQLRSAERLPACKLDLSRIAQVVEFPLADPPKDESLRLEIADLDRFTGKPTLATKLIPLGKVERIIFEEPAGAELQIRFQRLAAGEYQMRLEPQFRETGSRKFEMTIPKLKAMADSLAKTLANAESDLRDESKKVSRYESQLKSLEANRPKDIQQAAAWSSQASVVRTNLTRAANRVSILRRQIPLHKARLAAVPGLSSFLTALDGKATIRLRVIAQAGEATVVFVDGMADAPPQQAAQGGG